jgi:hypothetical protein
MFATITPCTVNVKPDHFQINIYAEKQLKKIIRIGGDYGQCVRYCEFEGLEDSM